MREKFTSFRMRLLQASSISSLQLGPEHRTWKPETLSTMTSFTMGWIMKCFQSVIEAIFGYSRYSNLSRPFTIEGQTYKVCMDCSQQIFYSRDTMLPLSRRELRHLRAEQATASVAMMPATAEAREARRSRKTAAA